MSSVDLGSPSRPVQPAPRGTQIILGVLVAVIASVLVNAVVAWVVTLVDPEGVPTGLTFSEYAPLTAVGVLGGAAGWATIRRFASRPRSVLRVLAPVVVGVSFVPDFVVLTAGASLINVAGLLIMHIAVAVIAILVLERVLPLSGRRAGLVRRAV